MTGQRVRPLQLGAHPVRSSTALDFALFQYRFLGDQHPRVPWLAAAWSARQKTAFWVACCASAMMPATSLRLRRVRRSIMGHRILLMNGGSECSPSTPAGVALNAKSSKTSSESMVPRFWKACQTKLCASPWAWAPKVCAGRMGFLSLRRSSRWRFASIAQTRQASCSGLVARSMALCQGKLVRLCLVARIDALVGGDAPRRLTQK